MRERVILIAVSLIGLLVAILGCSKDALSPSGLSDEEAIRQQISQADSVAEFLSSDDAVIDDQYEQAWEFGAVGKVATPIKVFRWGRKVDQITRTVIIVVEGDSAATATITKTITGHLVIAAAYSDTASFPETVIRKPFTERSERKVRFVRIARSTSPEFNWRPVALTLVAGKTLPDSLINFTITSLDVITPDDTFHVTNPLDTWIRLRRLRERLLFVGDSVKLRLTVLSVDSAAELAIQRHGGLDRHRARMHLVSNTPVGGGWERVYERVFIPHLSLGLYMANYSFVVDVISRESLYDDSAPFTNRFWGLPYAVRHRMRG